MTYVGEGRLQYAGKRSPLADLGRPGAYVKGARTAEKHNDFSNDFKQLEPLFDHLTEGKNVELLVWAINPSRRKAKGAA